MDQNGLVTVETVAGAFDDTHAPGVTNRLRNVETPEVSFGALVEGILREAEPGMGILIDPVTRRMLAADVSDLDDQLPGTLLKLVFGPVTGQTGRSLRWQSMSMDSEFPDEVSVPADAVVAEIRPSKTVGSLVTALLNSIPDGLDAADIPFICVDQRNGTVRLVTTTARASAEAFLEGGLDPLEPENGISLVLGEPAGGDSSEPHIFEGGAT